MASGAGFSLRLRQISCGGNAGGAAAGVSDPETFSSADNAATGNINGDTPDFLSGLPPLSPPRPGARRFRLGIDAHPVSPQLAADGHSKSSVISRAQRRRASAGSRSSPSARKQVVKGQRRASASKTPSFRGRKRVPMQLENEQPKQRPSATAQLLSDATAAELPGRVLIHCVRVVVLIWIWVTADVRSNACINSACRCIFCAQARLQRLGGSWRMCARSAPCFADRSVSLMIGERHSRPHSYSRRAA